MVTTARDPGWRISIGTPVYTADGEQLGTVVSADAYALFVVRGWLFRSEYEIALSDVERFEDGKLYLVLTTEQVQDAGS